MIDIKNLGYDIQDRPKKLFYLFSNYTGPSNN